MGSLTDDPSFLCGAIWFGKAAVDAADPVSLRTAFHFAIEYGYTDNARALLEVGAPWDFMDARGLTPLDLAERVEPNNGLWEVVFEGAVRFGEWSESVGVLCAKFGAKCAQFSSPPSPDGTIIAAARRLNYPLI